MPPEQGSLSALDEPGAPQPADVEQHKPANGLDDLLNELGELEALEPALEENPLEAAMASLEAGLTGNLPDSAPPPEIATDAGESASRPGAIARKILPGAMVVVVLFATNGLSFHLGTMTQLVHPATTRDHSALRPIDAPAPRAAGLNRYVGLASEAMIDGKTIFQNDEIKSAILELSGGMDLQSKIAISSRHYVSIEPISRTGSIIHVRSCHKLACARDNIRIDYDMKSQHAKVCMTEPYGEAGASVSYAFNHSGFREVTACNGDQAARTPATPHSG